MGILSNLLGLTGEDKGLSDTFVCVCVKEKRMMNSLPLTGMKYVSMLWDQNVSIQMSTC